MSNLSPTAVSRVFNSAIACDDPKTIRAVLDFDGTDVWEVSLEQQQQDNIFTGLQSIYVDASALTDRLIITVEGSNQRIIVPEATQGFYPVLAPNPPVFTFGNDNAGNIGVARVHFLNVPMPVGQWSTL